MSISIAHEPDSKLVIVTMSGKLDASDYENGLPIIEGYIRDHGKLNLLVYMIDFDGWTAGGLWEDIKFDVNHYRDVSRVALLGDEAWQKWAATICKPFTTGEVRYFPPEEKEAAITWAKGGEVPAGSR